MGVFDDVRDMLNGLFGISGDGWVQRTNPSSLNIEKCNGLATRDPSTNTCELCVALNGTIFKNNNKPVYTHENCRCRNQMTTLTKIVLDFPIKKITHYLFVDVDKHAMMRGMGYDSSDALEVYNFVASEVESNFLQGDYKLQLLNESGQHITIFFNLMGKRDKVGHIFPCHAGCVVWPNGKIKVATPVVKG